MSKRIRSMIDEIFSDMKMTAENLALRDELMANAFSRYEDAVAQGRSEEEAFEEVASSLEDVQGLLEELRRMDDEQAPQAEAQEEKEQAAPQTDLGGALNKAFSALGDFSQAIVPEAKKLVRGMDDATGGVLSKLSRAAQKGVRDAQKAAGDAIDKLTKEQGELIFDFGPKKKAEEKEEFVSEFDIGESEAPKEEKPEAAVLREQAKDMRAEAAIKDVTGDSEGAKALLDQADELERRADAMELADAVEAVCAAADTENRAMDEAEYTVRGEDDPLADSPMITRL